MIQNHLTEHDWMDKKTISHYCPFKYSINHLRVCSHVFSQFKPLGILQSEEEEYNVRIKTNKIIFGWFTYKVRQKIVDK
jgi:hypothetical protein